VTQTLVFLLVCAVIYLAVGEDLIRSLRPRARNYQVKYSRYLSRSVLIPFIIFSALALLMRDYILTPFLLAIGVFQVVIRIQQVIRDATKITSSMVLQLVLAFRSAYQLRPAAFDSLKEAATKVNDPLRSLVKSITDVYFLTSSPQRAFEEFRRRANDVLLDQFIYILEMSESASDTSMAEALDAFVTRLRQYQELQRQVETGLASVIGQTAFMQMLAIAVAFFVALIPSLRQAYVASFVGRIGYMIILSVCVAASYSIDKRTRDLKEQVL
jgi:hypothetical protein